ncbi:type II secretion system minor pseudopilin GspJ [Marinobacter sp. F3R08]|uniref:type II secretion system minor pseudopilin GspJ n=1 Tax=Marinobacter sp. F3R08 TaxID=2841559 RepID=UPI001C08C1DB|nr:type II secretion system minor pseudopilin GspJ [Marinobacter sp. F3R08]MBU2955974.1 type II secretion system minor pseudopilin GspJ [Marinobacter sp. F3R08]
MALSRKHSQNQQRGFTLLEVLIAVTITAVIGLGVWQVISGVVTSRDRVNELSEQFDGLQRAMLLMERDLMQVVNRPARDIYGDFQPALSSREEDFSLLLTRQGWRNPLGIRRSGLQRVGWEYTGSELRRRYWPMVDQGQEDDSRDVLLLEDVKSLEVRFLDSNRSWQSEWPTDEVMAGLTSGSRPDIPLPLGIEVTFEHERFGTLVRTFALPDFDPAIAQGVLNQVNEAASEADEEDSEEASEEQSDADSGVTEQGG